MKELAARTGLSLSSISRALDPARAHLVKQRTRELILREAEALNVQVNISARRLKLNKTETVTIITPNRKEPTTSHELHNISTKVNDLETLSAIIKLHGWDVKIEYYNENNPLDIKVFDKNRTDGIIFYGKNPVEYKHYIDKSKLPVVVLSRAQEDPNIPFPFVGICREAGYKEALDYVVKQNFTKIGWLCSSLKLKEEINYILDSLAKKYNYPSPTLTCEIFDYYDIRKFAEPLSKMDVVFCRNDVKANWLAREYKYMATKNPPLIIGYDNDPAFLNCPKDFDTIGLVSNPLPQLAVSMLAKMIQNPNIPHEQLKEIVPTQYIPSDMRKIKHLQ